MSVSWMERDDVGVYDLAEGCMLLWYGVPRPQVESMTREERQAERLRRERAVQGAAIEQQVRRTARPRATSKQKALLERLGVSRRVREGLDVEEAARLIDERLTLLKEHRTGRAEQALLDRVTDVEDRERLARKAVE